MVVYGHVLWDGPGRVGAAVQPAIYRLEGDAVYIDASAVARLDVVRVAAWPPDRGMLVRIRLSLGHARKRCHE